MSGSGNISYLPTDGLSYDPSEAKYWDEGMLAKEVERIFEVCHGCRMCFKYCDSFPTLFDLIDNRYDGDVRQLDDGNVKAVMDDCFQCKLCEVECPYTPRDSHEFQVDFPKLVHRYRAIQAKKHGIPFGKKLLADVDGGGAKARASLGMVNTMNRVRLHRVLFEKMTGVHRDYDLPDFAAKSFTGQAKAAGKLKTEDDDEALLFPTCFVENNAPEIGFDALKVLEKNGVGCGCEQGLACCGMPSWEHGDLDRVRSLARQNLDKLIPHVEAGRKVLAINPTCAMMFRREYPELLEGEDRARAERLAEAVQSPSEYLWSLRKEERFNTDFKSTPGPVAYHAPCHQRAQAVGFRGRDMIRRIPGTQPKLVMECCGHDGTYAMTVEGYEASQRIGKKAFDGMEEVEASEVWATDCPLAANQFAQHAERRPMHPMTILARAYEADGFPTPIEEED